MECIVYIGSSNASRWLAPSLSAPGGNFSKRRRDEPLANGNERTDSWQPAEKPSTRRLKFPQRPRSQCVKQLEGGNISFHFWNVRSGSYRPYVWLVLCNRSAISESLTGLEQATRVFYDFEELEEIEMCG
ncbi:hypothetical protein WN55_10542 [Dufourea novaeangliae]|uniref:Uncharacterized protein n=1 Tax=Dufourea novaeangliae TaxID=178035 RepID=A0A154P430_DUFNO|nr:hypothetical protein WN55_10542 [Dufourea novaeangliae]